MFVDSEGTRGVITGARLPVMSLPSAPDGAVTELWSGRGPKVIVVVHSASCALCREFIHHLGGEATATAEWGGRVSIVVREGLQAATVLRPSIPRAFLVLADPTGTLDLRAPALIIADEWGEVFFKSEGAADHDFPALAEVVEWLRFIAIQCPECEGPEGEWRTL